MIFSKKILNIKLPASFLLIFILFQLLFVLFKDFPLSRHPLDELIYQLDNSSENGKTVLLGDSITYDVAKRYQIGKENQVINLTTNRASGLIGSYFLLNRYFVNNQAVNDVIIISTPEFLDFIPHDQTATVYLTSVFKNKNEIEYLKALKIYEEKIFSFKSLIDIQNKLINPLVGIIKNKKKTIFTTGINPEEFKMTELPGGNEVPDQELQNRKKNKIDLSKRSKNIIVKMCELSKKNNFELHFVIAPIPETVYSHWRKNNQLNELKNSILTNKSNSCSEINFFDMNNNVNFPDYAFRDSDHLRSPGWTAKFARNITTFIDKLK